MVNDIKNRIAAFEQLAATSKQSGKILEIVPGLAPRVSPPKNYKETSRVVHWAGPTRKKTPVTAADQKKISQPIAVDKSYKEFSERIKQKNTAIPINSEADNDSYDQPIQVVKVDSKEDAIAEDTRDDLSISPLSFLENNTRQGININLAANDSFHPLTVNREREVQHQGDIEYSPFQIYKKNQDKIQGKDVENTDYSLFRFGTIKQLHLDLLQDSEDQPEQHDDDTLSLKDIVPNYRTLVRHEEKDLNGISLKELCPDYNVEREEIVQENKFLPQHYTVDDTSKVNELSLERETGGVFQTEENRSSISSCGADGAFELLCNEKRSKLESSRVISLQTNVSFSHNDESELCMAQKKDKKQHNQNLINLDSIKVTTSEVDLSPSVMKDVKVLVLEADIVEPEQESDVFSETTPVGVAIDDFPLDDKVLEEELRLSDSAQDRAPQCSGSISHLTASDKYEPEDRYLSTEKNKSFDVVAQKWNAALNKSENEGRPTKTKSETKSNDMSVPSSFLPTSPIQDNMTVQSSMSEITKDSLSMSKENHVQKENSSSANKNGREMLAIDGFKRQRSSSLQPSANRRGDSFTGSNASKSSANHSENTTAIDNRTIRKKRSGLSKVLRNVRSASPFRRRGRKKTENVEVEKKATNSGAVNLPPEITSNGKKINRARGRSRTPTEGGIKYGEKV